MDGFLEMAVEIVSAFAVALIIFAVLMGVTWSVMEIYRRNRNR